MLATNNPPPPLHPPPLPVSEEMWPMRRHRLEKWHSSTLSPNLLKNWNQGVRMILSKRLDATKDMLYCLALIEFNIRIIGHISSLRSRKSWWVISTVYVFLFVWPLSDSPAPPTSNSELPISRSCLRTVLHISSHKYIKYKDSLVSLSLCLWRLLLLSLGWGIHSEFWRLTMRFENNLLAHLHYALKP